MNQTSTTTLTGSASGTIIPDVPLRGIIDYDEKSINNFDMNKVTDEIGEFMIKYKITKIDLCWNVGPWWSDKGTDSVESAK